MHTGQGLEAYFMLEFVRNVRNARHSVKHHQSNVRSDQISGNSTTSSILRNMIRDSLQATAQKI